MSYRARGDDIIIQLFQQWLIAAKAGELWFLDACGCYRPAGICGGHILTKQAEHWPATIARSSIQ